MTETWLASLITETPQEGFELAIALGGRGVEYTQPDVEILEADLRRAGLLVEIEGVAFP